jgi:hypothetical protein
MNLILMILAVTLSGTAWADTSFKTRQQIKIIQEGETNYGYELREIVTKKGTHYILSNIVNGKESRRRFITPKFYARAQKEFEDLTKSYPVRKSQQRCEPEFQITIITAGGRNKTGRFCLAMIPEKRRTKVREQIHDLERQL